MQDDQGSSEGQMPEESGSAPGGAGRDDGQPGQAAGHAQPDLSADQAAPGDAGAGQPGPGYGAPGAGPDYGSLPGPGYSAPEPGYGQPGPGYRTPGPGYGASGAAPDDSQPGYGYTTPLGYPGGYGQAGGYYPPPGTRTRRRRTLLTYLTVAVVAAAAGAGVTAYAVSGSQNATPSANGAPAGGGTGNSGIPGGGFSGGGTSSGGVSASTKQAVVSAVRPGLVDISSNLGYQGSQAAATGMVISPDGLVLTNNHVITDTTQLYARVLTTGKQYRAKWLGYDSADDVAVIKLTGAHNLQTVPLGNSSGVKLGDKVIAIGNAYGAGRFPAVVGSITGTNRTITASDSGAATKETLHGMLQTNAGIVQGDSGGPLASTAGKVIGMDTAAATGSFDGTSQSVGFAIPIDKALRIARQIINGRSSPSVKIGSTGFLGVLVPAGQASRASSPQQQRDLQLKQDQGSSGFPVQPSAPICLQNQEGAGVPAHVAPVASGALIIGELCKTPADTAGIVAGDVITSVGGHRISSPVQLTGVMQGFRPGMSVKVTWVDVNGNTHNGNLVLKQAPPH
ncbi:MAG TPA: trypsin-like peptidase domain-containing protein [Streptosporangiaceae bacterium]|nr:trypsin-like peptidase domain-containing protein [Streptosporangiaceae bacterium]